MFESHYYIVKMGPFFVSSAFIHFKKHQKFLLTWSILCKKLPNFVEYQKLILHNRSHASTYLWHYHALWRMYHSISFSNSASEVLAVAGRDQRLAQMEGVDFSSTPLVSPNQAQSYSENKKQSKGSGGLYWSYLL